MSYVDWIRGQVGRRKIFLAFSSVALFDGNGRILLQHRADFDLWGLPGGVLEMDENLETCARRELAEETGLIVGDLRLVGMYTDPRYDVTYPNGDEAQQCTACFAGMVNGGQMQADGKETKALAFVSPGEAARLPMRHWYRDMIRDALAGGPPAFLPPFARESLVDQIGSLRRFVGTAPIITIGASAAVVRDDGRILMVRRRDNGAWVFPAGYSDLGENVAHTITREMREETGLDIEPERMMAVYSSPDFHHTYPNGDQVKNVGVLFRARLLGGTARLEEAEITEMAWMTPDEILANVNEWYRRLAEPALPCLDEGYVVL